jgi:pSer/pThr/pTyr-binding forkhead associated (FHA) protein
MTISLIPLNGGAPIVLSHPVTLVGRNEECDVQLEEEGIADLHCIFALTDDLLLLRDLGTHSIHVNDQRVRRAVLLPDDRVKIANSELRVKYEQGD